MFHGFASNKLSVQKVMSITLHVYTVLCDHGFHIASIGYDGQFYKLAVESNSGAPLTLLGCQKKKLWTYISKLYHGELKWCTIAESQEKEDDTQVQDGDY